MDQAKVHKAAKAALELLLKDACIDWYPNEASGTKREDLGPMDPHVEEYPVPALAEVREHLEFIIENTKRKRTAADRARDKRRQERKKTNVSKQSRLKELKAKVADLKKETS